MTGRRWIKYENQEVRPACKCPARHAKPLLLDIGIVCDSCKRPFEVRPSTTEEPALLTDNSLLEYMDVAALHRRHFIFDQYEDVLFHRYVKWSMETADIPFDREKLVREFFPEEIQDRYLAIREKIYPKL